MCLMNCNRSDNHARVAPLWRLFRLLRDAEWISSLLQDIWSALSERWKTRFTAVGGSLISLLSDIGISAWITLVIPIAVLVCSLFPWGIVEKQRARRSIVTVSWDEGHTWKTNNLRQTCEHVLEWLGTVHDTTITLDGYGESWILHDADSGLWLPKAVALFSGLKRGVPKKLQILVLEEPQKKREAWKIVGARRQKFKMYVAACLLAGDESAWPLPTERARDEYAALSKAVRSGRLDGPGEPEDTLSFEFGWREGDEADDHPDTTHEINIDRRTLREYLRSIGRSIPEFLEERFDGYATNLG